MSTVTVENEIIRVVEVGVQGPSGGQPVPRFPYVDFIADADPMMSAVGRTAWDAANLTLKTLLSLDGVILQHGQELHLRARNAQGAQINNGQIVYIYGATGQNPTVKLADADSFDQSRKCLAMATHNVAINAVGFFTIIGAVNDLNTHGIPEGSVLYLSQTPGGYTVTPPAYPANRVCIGVCAYENPSVGKISFGVHHDLRKFGDPENGDFTGFEDDGLMVANGAARTWRDEKNDALTLKQQGSGVSSNVTESVVEFTTGADLNDYLYANVQLNHDRDESEVIHPHIHFFQASNAVPNFLLEYRWQINGGAKVTAWTRLACRTAVHAYTSGTRHQIARTVAGITPPVGSDLSDIVQFRIYRDNANASGAFSGADPYTGTVGILSFDVHVKLNTMGSQEQYDKGVT